MTKHIPNSNLLILCASAVLMVGCGGGGGGAAGGYLNNSTPAGSSSTLIRVGTIKPLNGTTTTVHEASLNSYDLDGRNGEELIVVGRANMNDGTSPTDWKNFDISIWGWNGNTMVNQTNQWFGSGINRTVIGVEDQVMFGDFDGDGHKDIYLGPNTDTSSVLAGINGANTGAIFFNSGASSFNQRAEISLGPNISAHASYVADVNNDGIDDIWSTTGAVSKVIIGDRARNLRYLDVAGMPQAGGSGLAVADFTAVGTKSVIFVDQGSAPAPNNLYSYNIDWANNLINLSHVSALPAPRFSLPKWAGYGFGAGSHDIRVLADVELKSGKTASSQGVVSDAVIFSRPNQYANGQWPEYQEVQFLLNNGRGTFSDITDTVFKGFNHNSAASYNQVFKDVNNDGRLDIIIPGNSWENNRGSQVLIWRSASNAYGFEYQSYYNVVLAAMQDNALQAERAITSTAVLGGNGVALIRDPSGNFFIATAVDYESGGAKHKAIYMTALNSLTPTATITALRANWPWLTDSQVQTILAQSTTTYFGMNLLDPKRALSPIGSLIMPTQFGARQITGSVAGLALNGAAQNLMVQDSLGRPFGMDYSATRMDMINSWAARLDHDDSSRSMAMVTGLKYNETLGFRYGANDENTNQIFGMPMIPLGSSVSGSWQFTTLNYSPWIRLSGSWGQVRSSSTMETAVTWRQDSWRARTGLMYSVTNINPGLVTQVNPIVAAWGDLAYLLDRWNLSVGMLPKIISGSADLNLPTGVDNQGRIQYTNIKAGFDNPTAGFAKVAYQTKLSKKTSFDSAAMTSTQNSYSIRIGITSQW